MNCAVQEKRIKSERSEKCPREKNLAFCKKNLSLPGLAAHHADQPAAGPAKPEAAPNGRWERELASGTNDVRLPRANMKWSYSRKKYCGPNKIRTVNEQPYDAHMTRGGVGEKKNSDGRKQWPGNMCMSNGGSEPAE